MWSFSAPRAPRRVNRLLGPQMVWRLGFPLVIPLTAILLATIMGVASGQMFDLRPDRPQHPKIHFRLFDLLSLESTPPPQKEGLIRIDENGRVQVYIKAKPATQELLEQIETLGGKIDGQGLGVIQAWVPITALEELAARPEVLYISPPEYGHPNVGSVNTQGDAVLKASNARQQFGVTGQGVRIGVISTGLKGLETSIASGDLPSTTFHCRGATITTGTNGCRPGETLVETSDGVTGKSFRSNDGDLAVDGEGTAMLEIIHDLAPRAELWFASVGFDTTLDLTKAAKFLTANVDVVVSDIGFFPFFPNGQNTLSEEFKQILANSSNRSRAFFQSVGNHADKHYAGLYTGSGFGNALGEFHRFSAISGETTGPSTPLPSNKITLPPGGSVIVFLSWNDPAGASTNNYDLGLFDCASEILLAASEGIQNGVQEPSEKVQYTNPFQFSFEVCYVIQNVLQAAPRTLNVIINPTKTIGHNFNTPGHSLTAPADAKGNLIAVGAVHHSSPNQVELFSSQGPTFDGRIKPDLVATDGVAVTGAGGFDNFFFGTSASAPHAAAIAALLLEANPSLTFDQIRNALTSTAIDLGVSGLDNVYGHGRIDALAAVNSLVGMPANTAPTVNAGAPQTITFPNGVALDGTVSDDGLPNPPGTVTTTWGKVSGPGTVTFGNPNAVDTTASFSQAGTYVLQLTANDSDLSAFNTTTITVNSASIQNQAPSVNAGPAQTVNVSNTATLDGTVTDDGLPNPPGVVTTLWSKVSGPGVVIFGNANAVDTFAAFTSGGTYVLRLTASDGALSTSADVTITVNNQGGRRQSSDVNGDGKADVVWRNTRDSTTAIWLMNGTAIASSGFPAGVPLAWQIKGVGDVNGDGKADVIWHNTSGTVAVWMMNGVTVTSVGLSRQRVDGLEHSGRRRCQRRRHSRSGLAAHQWRCGSLADERTHNRFIGLFRRRLRRVAD